jgi:choline dehydrogenase-like flavoprotein
MTETAIPTADVLIVGGGSFGDVLPTFKAMENTPEGDDAYHSRSGPLPLRRRSYDELPLPIRAFVDAVVTQGFKRGPEVWSRCRGAPRPASEPSSAENVRVRQPARRPARSTGYGERLTSIGRDGAG